jgi:hypothetical protein
MPTCECKGENWCENCAMDSQLKELEARKKKPEYVNGVVQDINKFVADSENGGTVNLYFLSPNVTVKDVKALKPCGAIGIARITPPHWVSEHNKPLRRVPCAYTWIS